jgi:hypothetical protein
MVDTENFQNKADLRKEIRRAFRRAALILSDPNSAPRPCMIEEISDSGARISFEWESELSGEFFLLLTPNGTVRRRCRLGWREGSTVDVEFIVRDTAAAQKTPETPRLEVPASYAVD